jgi:hypothetical protein
MHRGAALKEWRDRPMTNGKRVPVWFRGRYLYGITAHPARGYSRVVLAALSGCLYEGRRRGIATVSQTGKDG